MNLLRNVSFSFLFLLCSSVLVCPGVVGEEPGPFFQLPDNPVEGGRLFIEKGCASCHAIQGLGGAGGPDLGKVRAAWSFLDIAGVMWNHSPKMEAEFERRKITRPQFTSEEMFQLIAFVYLLNSFDNPGDPAHGEILFLRKNCNACHSIGGSPRAGEIPLDGFRPYRSSAYISAALWNAARDMTDAMRDSGIPRHALEGDDIVDLLAYIRHEAAPGTEDQRAYLPPGSPVRGARLFRDKGCVRCHPVRGRGVHVAPDLGFRDYGGGLSQVAAEMLNHGPAMWTSMSEVGVEVPSFSGEEMSDILIYLYFTKFIDLPGDPKMGEALFEGKGCADCHATSADEVSIGLSVGEMKLETAAGAIASMWNHASEMEDAAHTVNVAWPQLRPGEMAHLVAFIQSQRDKSQ